MASLATKPNTRVHMTAYGKGDTFRGEVFWGEVLVGVMFWGEVFVGVMFGSVLYGCMILVGTILRGMERTPVHHLGHFGVAGIVQKQKRRLEEQRTRLKSC